METAKDIDAKVCEPCRYMARMVADNGQWEAVLFLATLRGPLLHAPHCRGFDSPPHHAPEAEPSPVFATPLLPASVVTASALTLASPFVNACAPHPSFTTTPTPGRTPARTRDSFVAPFTSSKLALQLMPKSHPHAAAVNNAVPVAACQPPPSMKSFPATPSPVLRSASTIKKRDGSRACGRTSNDPSHVPKKRKRTNKHQLKVLGTFCFPSPPPLRSFFFWSSPPDVFFSPPSSTTQTEASFSATTHPPHDLRERLGQTLGLSPRQYVFCVLFFLLFCWWCGFFAAAFSLLACIRVQVWFQNRRQKAKRARIPPQDGMPTDAMPHREQPTDSRHHFVSLLPKPTTLFN
jgi:hypothetical protein